jgi:hypothetical protein
MGNRTNCIVWGPNRQCTIWFSAPFSKPSIDRRTAFLRMLRGLRAVDSFTADTENTLVLVFSSSATDADKRIVLGQVIRWLRRRKLLGADVLDPEFGSWR